MVKLALLKGNLSFLVQISDYPEIYHNEPVLFEMAKNHFLNNSATSYKFCIKMILNSLKQNLCAFEYEMYPGEGVELVFYTDKPAEENAALEQELSQKIIEESEKNNLDPLEDIFIRLDPINTHPSWLESN